jgi:hypothetical protein
MDGALSGEDYRCFYEGRGIGEEAIFNLKSNMKKIE